MTGEQLRELARKVLEVEARAVLAARERVGAEMEAAVRLIRSRCPPGKVVVTGIGKSGHVARKIAATLASTGTPAFFVHPAEAGHGDLGMIGRADVVLALSHSGQAQEILALLPYFKRHGIPLVALTGDRASPLAAHAEHCLDGAVEQEACPLGLAPTSSTTLALALGDALAVCLLELRGFTPEHFAQTHPHGALGRRLLVTVAELMLKGAEVPCVAPGATVRETLVEMNRGGIGISAVAGGDGRLLGVFTDGDLRRAVDREVDLKRTPIREVMTRAPQSIGPSQLASEAARVMERGKVSALPVLDDGGRLVGALNMRILLRAGVV
jgi:arabinose-5-phosphate isomerase